MRLRVVSKLRLALFLIVLCVSMALGGWIAGARASAAASEGVLVQGSPAGAHVLVSPGDTLWDIACANAPSDMDPRMAVYVLRHHNSLATANIVIGQRLAIPASWAR